MAANYEPNEFEKRALGLIRSDPVANFEMQKHLARIDPSMKPVLPEVALQEKIAAAVDPLKKELEETRKALSEKKEYDRRSYEWEQLHKLGWKDSQIEELEKRMTEDENRYGSYVAAAKYYQAMDSPSLPNSGSRRDVGISGHPKSKDDWRARMEEDGELRKLALAGDKTRRKRKAMASDDWAKARAEFRGR